MASRAIESKVEIGTFSTNVIVSVPYPLLILYRRVRPDELSMQTLLVA
jgi:hypothetical protein